MAGVAAYPRRVATWTEFVNAEPQLADLVQQRLDATGMVMLGTLRRNGWPRISPCEFLYVDDELMLGMMWQSKKALDLLRDPRCTLHSITTDPDGGEGDAKIYALAVDVQDSRRRARFREVTKEQMDFDLEEPEFHVFAMDIQAVAYVVASETELSTRVWQA